MKFFLILFLAVGVWAESRVIALSPAINEIIFALGEERSIVANTTFCNFPKSSKKIPKVGGFFSPSLERILQFRPDMVIMQSNNQRLYEQLKKLGFKSMVLKMQNLKNIKKSILKIGNYFEKTKEAKKIIFEIDERLENLKNIVKNQKILVAIGHNTDLSKNIFVAGENLYFDDIITISGNKNAFFSKRIGQPILNMENIIALNPDIVIILAPYRKKKKLTIKDLKNPWLALPINAAKNGNIFIEDREYAGVSSQRLIYFLEDFREFLLSVKDR